MTIYDFSAKTITGEEKIFRDYEGKVLLIVNTASKCGFVYQFQGLEDLYQHFRDDGLIVIGFPCNQFAKQEPCDKEGIIEFTQGNYGVTFPMMEKICVNGKQAHPIYQWLKSQKKGMLTRSIKWNFTKFLIGRDGQVIDRFAPITEPIGLLGHIEQALRA